MDIECLWAQAYQDAIRGDLAQIIAKGANLASLESIRVDDAHKFASLVRQKDLASLGLPNYPRHKSKLHDLFHIIYRCAPAFDVLAQSHFILTLTWGTCRLLVQIARDYYTLSDKTKDILVRILSYAEHWRNEASFYEDNLQVKDSIKTLFYNIIVLVGVARHNSQGHRLKRLLKVLAPNIVEQRACSLQQSAELVDRALRCAAGQTQKEHRQETSKLLRDLDNSHRELRQEIHRKGIIMLPTTSHHAFTQGGEEPSITAWLTPDCVLDNSRTVLVPDTCRWPLATPEWTSWSTGNHSGLLILTGPPGSGKTCIARFAAQHFKVDPSRPTLSYFFNSASGSAFNKAEVFLASILAQLYQKLCGTPQERVFELLKQQRSHYPTIWQCPFLPLLALVEEVLQRLTSYVLVVDSVDECETSETNRWSVLAFLTTIARKDGVAALATCRSSISFTSLGHAPMDLRLFPESVHDDIVRYVEYEVGSRLGLQDHQHDELRHQVVDAVVKGSQDNFLHAKLLIDVLHQQRTPREIRDTINNFGHAYATDLYEQLFRAKDEVLSAKARARRQCILRLLVAAQEPLSAEQINEFLAINEGTVMRDKQDLSLNILRDLEELCGPFVSVSSSGWVTFFHASAKEFFGSRSSTAKDESNLYLASKCLAVLSQNTYRNPERATKLLRQHLLPTNHNSRTGQECSIDSPIYEYAAKYFHEHIIAIPKPPAELSTKLGRFLRGIEFVTWSESILDLKPGTSYAGQIIVYAALSKWTITLPLDDQQDILIDQYFETAHELLSLILKDEEKDQISQFLPRIRLGDYFNGAGQSTNDWRKAYKQKQIVVGGLSALLPEKHPLLLKSRAALLQEYLWQKRFAELLDELQDLYKLQKEVVGDSKDDIYVTAWMIGAAQVALTRYDEAKAIISETLERVRQLHGEKYRFFNVLLFLEGTRLDRIHGLHQAAACYRAAITTLTKTAGSQNVFVLTLRTALGAVLRKQRKYDEAERDLLVGWGGRQPLFSVDLNVSVDAALQLAMLYRDKGDGSECLKILDSIHRSNVFEEDFERYCQIVHLRNLVALDNSEYIVARHALMELLQSATGANRGKNNRELLWVRLDLSDAMRSHGESDKALTLFSNLVEAAESTTINDEAESPSQLRMAEKALRLVRNAEFAESRRLLQAAGLRWVREADFWFSFQGGPILDTSVIAPLRSQTDLSLQTMRTAQ